MTIISNIPYFRNNYYVAFPMNLNFAYNEICLGITERVFYVGFINIFGTEATVSHTELSEWLGLSETTVKRIIVSLKEKGLLEIQSGIGRSVKNQYKIKYLYYETVGL